MAISRRLRFEILRRDGYTCRYCGAKSPDVALTVDHVIPVTLGGPDEPANLVTACQPCNAGKASIPADAEIVEDVAADTLRWRRAIETATIASAAELSYIETQMEEFMQFWADNPSFRFRLVDEDRESVRVFLENGLTLTHLKRFAEKANAKPGGYDGRWRYFCGCCWRAISDIHEDARRIVEDE